MQLSKVVQNVFQTFGLLVVSSRYGENRHTCPTHPIFAISGGTDHSAFRGYKIKFALHATSYVESMSKNVNGFEIKQLEKRHNMEKRDFDLKICKRTFN